MEFSDGAPEVTSIPLVEYLSMLSYPACVVSHSSGFSEMSVTDNGSTVPGDRPPSDKPPLWSNSACDISALKDTSLHWECVSMPHHRIWKCPTFMSSMCGKMREDQIATSPRSQQCDDTETSSSNGADPDSLKAVNLLNSKDWSKTVLGARETWPEALETAVSICMAAPFQCCIWWGPKLILIYNDAYSEVVGTRHPEIFGQPGNEVWSELWDYLEPIAATVMSGQTISKNDDLLIMTRNGYAEETYHSWAWMPIKLANGEVGGLFNPDFEMTKKIISERRLVTLKKVGERTMLARTVAEYPQALIEGLSTNLEDVPFALFYSSSSMSGSECHASPGIDGMDDASVHSSEGPASDSSKFGSDVYFKLRATLGIDSGHSLAKPELFVSADSWRVAEAMLWDSIDSSVDDDLDWPIRKACISKKAVFVQNLSETAAISNRAEHLGLVGKINSAVVLTINATDGSVMPEGILILGVNPHRSYDEDYATWINVLEMQLASSMAGVLSFETTLKQTERLSQLDRQKSAFFQNCSHELRTPLTLISAPIHDLCDDQTLSGSKRQILRLVNRNVQRLTRLVNTLLDVSKLDSAKMETDLQPVNIGKITSELGGLFRSAVEDAGLVFEIECDTREVTSVVDVSMWEKIVTNLLSNALKYTMRGKITLACTLTDDDVVLSVSDTGCGIPSSELSKIFERFHRVEGVSRSFEGTGIGLSFCKDLVTLLNGTIKVSSVWAGRERGHSGSTFTVKIPRVPLDFANKNQIYEKVTEERSTTDSYAKIVAAEGRSWTTEDNISAPSESGSSSESNGHTSIQLGFLPGDIVLVVDDNMDMRQYLSSILSAHCHVLTAADGKEGFDTAQEKRPNLILSDVSMPRMNGYALMSAVRNHPELKLVPIILLSARVGEDATIEGLLGGADDYVPKPFQAKELVARIGTHISFGRKRILIEKQYQARTQEFRTMAENSPIGIVRLSYRDASILYANTRFHEISGFERDSSDNSLKALSKNKSEDGMIIQKFVETRQGVTWDMKLSNGNMAEITLNAVESNDYFLCSVLDISDRYKLQIESERRLYEAEERRKEVEAAKTAQELMIDVTSHELRNPISAVLQNAEICKSNLHSLYKGLKRAQSNNSGFTATVEVLKDIEDDLESLDSILSCSQAAELICNDILRLAQIELNTLIMREVTFPVVQKAKDVLRIFHNEARSKGIKLELVIDDSLKNLNIVNVKQDPVRLGQIMINLISNAVHYLQKSVVRVISLRISATLTEPPEDSHLIVPPLESSDSSVREGDAVWLIYSISDTGPGIALPEQSILFKRFQQGSNAIHSLLGGSGLGLYICRQLSERMKGRIEVESELGHGSHFRFSIKAEITHSPEAQSPVISRPMLLSSNSYKSYTSDSTSASPIVSPAYASNPHTKKLPAESKGDILIVEDNPVNSSVLARQLQRAGYRTAIANHGQEALDKIQASYSKEAASETSASSAHGPFKACLCDLHMPVMNGIEAVKKLRMMEVSGALPDKHIVIAVTGNAREGQREEAIAAGMDEVVIKPYRITEVLIRMERLWAKKSEGAFRRGSDMSVMSDV